MHPDVMPAAAAAAARRARVFLIALVTTALVYSFAPAASAQMGVGGSGGGSSAGGGGGGGNRGNKGKENKPKVKRNEAPVTDPDTARTKLKDALAMSLTRGTATAPYLANLFDQASTGAVPASVQARKAFAELLAVAVKGKKLEAEPAGAIAEPLSSVINIDGLTPEDVTAKKDGLKDALGTAGMSEEQVVAAMAALDRIVADQQDETVKKIMADLDEIQKEGNAPDDKKKSLAENITALATSAKPDDAAVTKLAEDLTKGADSAQLTRKEQGVLAHHFRAVVNAVGMPPAQFMPLLNDVKATLKAGLVKQADINAVAADLQAIQKSLASAPATAPAAPAAAAVGGEGER